MKRGRIRFADLAAVAVAAKQRDLDREFRRARRAWRWRAMATNAAVLMRLCAAWARTARLRWGRK